MQDLTIRDMFRLQEELHDAYEEDWSPLCPEQSISSLLWTLGEMGEVIDILKKEGTDAILHDHEVRLRCIEEICDVLMHFTDTMICLEITPEEIASSFNRKQKMNMTRWKSSSELD